MQQVKAKLAGNELPETINVDLTTNEVEYRQKKLKASNLSWQSPVTGTIYGTLFNYKGTLDLVESQLYDAPYNEPPKKPILYIKPRNTINSHHQPIRLPESEQFIQICAALGVVIGKTATQVRQTDAFDVIDGYTVVNDVSVPHNSFYRPDIKNKVRDGFCPIGPWIVPQKAVHTPETLDVRVVVNNQLVQENNTKNLVRSIPQLIAEVTDFMTLYKGDLLLVGVPENPPQAKVGDHIRIEIPGIGTLENTVVAGGDVL